MTFLPLFTDELFWLSFYAALLSLTGIHATSLYYQPPKFFFEYAAMISRGLGILSACAFVFTLAPLFHYTLIITGCSFTIFAIMNALFPERTLESLLHEYIVKENISLDNYSHFVKLYKLFGIDTKDIDYSDNDRNRENNFIFESVGDYLLFKSVKQGHYHVAKESLELSANIDMITKTMMSYQSMSPKIFYLLLSYGVKFEGYNALATQLNPATITMVALVNGLIGTDVSTPHINYLSSYQPLLKNPLLINERIHLGIINGNLREYLASLNEKDKTLANKIISSVSREITWQTLHNKLEQKYDLFYKSDEFDQSFRKYLLDAADKLGGRLYELPSDVNFNILSFLEHRDIRKVITAHKSTPYNKFKMTLQINQDATVKFIEAPNQNNQQESKPYISQDQISSIAGSLTGAFVISPFIHAIRDSIQDKNKKIYISEYYKAIFTAENMINFSLSLALPAVMQTLSYFIGFQIEIPGCSKQPGSYVMSALLASAPETFMLIGDLVFYDWSKLNVAESDL